MMDKALDLLMPAFSSKLAVGSSHMPIWVWPTKRIMAEEGHSISILIHILQLIVRHSQLFYGCRAQFVPQIVNSITRLGLASITTIENRRLAVELAGVVIGWEKQRQSQMLDVANSETLGQNFDGSNPANTVDADPKGTVDQSVFTRVATNQVKVESGLESLGVTCPGVESSVPNIKTSRSAGRIDQSYKPTAAMEEVIIRFLIKVSLPLDLLFRHVDVHRIFLFQ